MEETLKEALLDIRSKLQNRVYTNEEHVRLSLVARILQKLEWNIWNPQEVNTEFATLPDENRKKVDIALFLTPRHPSVFIEVKAVGKIENNLRDVERQLRDYNSEITSPFCIITDGCIWRFYLSQTGGKFYEKCFKTLDFGEGNIDEIEDTLKMFLGRSKIQDELGELKNKAEKIIEENKERERKYKAVRRHFPEAHRLALRPPFPNLPDALTKLTNEKEEDVTVSREEVIEFINEIEIDEKNEKNKKIDEKGTEGEYHVRRPDPLDPDAIVLNPHNPSSLTHAKIRKGRVGEINVRNWNALVRALVKTAIQRGNSISQLQRWVQVPVEEGNIIDRGFHPIPGLDISVQGLETNNAWKTSLAIAQKLKMPIEVEFYWLKKEGAAHPGQKGILRWSP